MPVSVELVKIALRAYGDGDVEIALALSDPMVRWDERASRPEGELAWGRDEVARGMRRYLEGWQRYSLELEDVAEATPGTVVGICRERGLDEQGVPVDRRFGAVWVVAGAKIASWSTYLTPREAVRAARELGGGGSETPPDQPRQAPVEAQQAPAEPQQAPPQLRALEGTGPGRRVPSEEQRRAARARAQLRHQAAGG